MREKFSSLLILFFMLFWSFSVYGGENIQKRNVPSTHNQVVFYFIPGTSEFDDQDLDIQCAKLDPFENYRIHGYACNDDKGSDSEMLKIAERRATKIRELLVQRGFSKNNLTTVAYDKGSKCIAVVVKVGN